MQCSQTDSVNLLEHAAFGDLVARFAWLAKVQQNVVRLHVDEHTSGEYSQSCKASRVRIAHVALR